MSGLMFIWQIFRTWKMEIGAGLVLLAVILLLVLLISQRKNLQQNKKIAQQITGLSKLIEKQGDMLQEKPQSKIQGEESFYQKENRQRKKEEELFGSVMEEIFS